jgi:hypothetical protein
MKFLLLSLLTLASCGESPLFNHDMEKAFNLVDSRNLEAQELKFKKTDFSFSLVWEMGPQIGESRFIVKTWKNSVGTMNGPYQDLELPLHIILWMPSMGHGSAPVKITKVSEGEYEVTDVHFIMGGKWDIKFQLKKGNQVFDETILPIRL